ncbi:hypothetical protein RJT34_17874 [Clitoria ternatea]|uniref:Uncharacterized protein n=1 Tax=Clitoria ternatea TaxID=43366 RepID=A0AAN9JBY8_CLITE
MFPQKRLRKTFREFFSFSGDIEYVEMKSLDKRSQTAYVTFKDAQGAETAVLLLNGRASYSDTHPSFTKGPSFLVGLINGKGLVSCIINLVEGLICSETPSTRKHINEFEFSSDILISFEIGLRLFFMETWRCIKVCIYLLAWSSFIWSPGSCLLGDSVSSQVVDSTNCSTNNRNAEAFSPNKKFLMQSYYDKYTNLHDSDFEISMSQEVTSGLCEGLLDNHNLGLRFSDLKRNLIGEGSHRCVSTLIKLQTQQSKSMSELSSHSCEFIIIERLPSGVFADPFELQRLVERGVFSDIAVFGDTNLELPSFLSNRSAVEIHLDVDPNMFLEPTDIRIELPLHARYQPLNESGYTTVEFSAPDLLVRCSTKEKVENRRCIFKLQNDEANLDDAHVVWRIPCGRKAHGDVVSTVTFIAALLSTLAIVVASLYYSNTSRSKDLKQS